ncbi:MAG: FtsQ-type POTRA domain-containing protein [Chloroflexi bacterium]|nr:FtsQ-type POTRA domain-containing protein [Chloroflexota bacterium]
MTQDPQPKRPRRSQPSGRPPGQRLRKQPQMRQVQSAHVLRPPRIAAPAVPPTARHRRRRNRRQATTLPLQGLKGFVFSARWLSLGLLLFTVFALYLAATEEQFYLTTIPVTGTISIPPAEVVAASGLGGAHVFAADPNEAAARIAQLPGVVASKVTLSWPNQVEIEIVEDTPIAVWQEGGQQFWITKRYELIPARTPAIGLLTIEYEAPPTPSADSLSLDEMEGTGETAVSPHAAIGFIPNDVLLGALQLRQLRPNIDKLYYRPASGLSYQDGRGWRAYFGTGTDMNQKLAVYETIVADLQVRQIQPAYVSVSNQAKPYYKAP